MRFLIESSVSLVAAKQLNDEKDELVFVIKQFDDKSFEEYNFGVLHFLCNSELSKLAFEAWQINCKDSFSKSLLSTSLIIVS